MLDLSGIRDREEDDTPIGRLPQLTDNSAG